MDRLEIGDGRSFLIALPEKALADKVQSDRGLPLRSRKELGTYLFDNLRLEPETLKEFDPERLEQYAK